MEQIGAKDVKGARQVWEPGEEMAKFAEVLFGNAEMRLRLLLGKTSTGDLDSTAIEDKEDKFTRIVYDVNLEKKKLPVQRLELIQPIEAGTVTTKSQE